LFCDIHRNLNCAKASGDDVPHDDDKLVFSLGEIELLVEGQAGVRSFASADLGHRFANA
jgi:hypothetical protein